VHHPGRPALLWLALLVAAPAAPAAAHISSVDTDAAVEALSATDGTFDSPPRIEQAGFTQFDETVTAQTDGGAARGTAHVSVTQTTDSVTATASGGTDISHCCAADDRPMTGAGASSKFVISVCVDERSTFTASGSASVQSSGKESSSADFDVCCDANGDPLVTVATEDAAGAPRSAGRSVSGVLDPDSGPSCVGVSAGDSSSLGSGQPSSATSWSLSLRVDSSPRPAESQAFLWVAGGAGAFGNPESWDPAGPESEGVPTFVDGVRQDAAVVALRGPVTMDLAGGAAGRESRASSPRGIERRMGRLVVARSRSLRPIGGTLILDNLGVDLHGVAPTVDGRSLEIGRGGVLTLDQGIVEARHVAIGSGGDGELDVVGPGGGFTALGRFGVGADGNGSVSIENGATVTTAETVLGEGHGQGSATAQGQGTLWQTGNLAVGFAGPAALEVEGGARVESESAVVDCEVGACSGLSEDERAGVVLDGEDGGGTPSTWLLADTLEVGASGKVSVQAGARLEALLVKVGTSGSEADCIAGRACLELVDGTIATSALGVGLAGAGKVQIGPGGRLQSLGLGTSLAATFGSRGEVVVNGPAPEAQLRSSGLLIGEELASHGELRLRDGARVTSTRDVLVGTTGEGTDGLIELTGDAASADETVLRVEGPDTRLDLGADSPEPAEQLVPPTGEIVLSEGVVELVDADLDVERSGEISGLGTIRGQGVSFVSNNGVIGCGVLVDAAYTQSEQGVLECPESEILSLAQLSPLAAARFGRAVRARLLPPPPPPAGPFVVTGDATLGGTLVLQFLNGFAPAQGDAFPVLDLRGAANGDFANVVVRGLAPGSFDFDRSDQDGVVTFTSLTDAVALPAVSLIGKTKLKEKKKSRLKLKVQRTGDRTAPLRVSYRTGGTAKNGVDYDLLPGVIEIPAGKRSAKLVVKPRRDGALESPETIDIQLLPGADYAPSLASRVTIELRSVDRLKRKRG
jgi:T5SS/PEP-CTERM-associated repeat protein